MIPQTILLASASPRRSELLDQIGITHRIQPTSIDETPTPGEIPQDYALRLALEKAHAGFRNQAGEKLPTLGADTIVVIDNQLLGKPADRDQGLAMLRQLSGRTHKVISAVALYSEAFKDSRLSISQVTFRPMREAELQAYWESGEPADKAGAYGIQGLAARFIQYLEGSYSGVMGLPLYETAQLLESLQDHA